MDQQRLPPGLYVVATPIGNLGDLSPRAADTLRRADLVLAEDKRVTAKLLAHVGAKAPMANYNDHTSEADRNRIVARLAGEAIALVRDKYEDAVHRALEARKVRSAVLYLEFVGPRSFAGRHADEPHDVVLLDVATFGRGLVPPDEFLQIFGHLDTARLLYQGQVDREFVAAVRAGRLPGMTCEGVVCKSTVLERRVPVMFKIKSQAWLDRLRDVCAGDDALFAALA